MTAIQTEKKILVLDDEVDILEILNDLLDSEGYKVTTFSNGHDALEKVKVEKFDLIISDIKMPVMNGVDFFKKCKEFNNYKNFIFITGYAELSKDEALKLGATNFYMKPLDLDYLIDEINALLN
jgi:DNA-binding NtrC family response regulator